jgi:N-acetyl-gamma-glutamyl-phosphate reductase
MLPVTILGASGYSGQEALDRVLSHPELTPIALGSDTLAGNPAHALDPRLARVELPAFVSNDEALAAGADLILCCLDHERAAALEPPDGAVVVDLSGAHRLEAAAYPEWYGFEHPAPGALADAVYGLTEHARDRLPGARLIANPGCYPTATLLALVPFARAGLLAGDVIIDAKSGVSGAGRSAGGDFLYTELEGGTRPYGIPRHRHTPEIAQGLAAAGADGVGVTFVPHLVPQVRGIVSTCYLSLGEDLDDEALTSILDDAYDAEPFVHPVRQPPSSKLASGSNHAFLFAARTGPRRAVVVGAIDNLGKGAAGQAVQNMNVALGLPETAGLETVGLYP